MKALILLALTQYSAHQHLQLAGTLEKMGLYNLAAVEYVTAAKSAGDAQAALTALGAMAEREGLSEFSEFTAGKIKKAQPAKGSPAYFKAEYLSAAALAKAGKNEEALRKVKALAAETAGAPETDYNRNAALAGVARIYYKMNDWDKALEYYRMVPKDSELWHEVLLEMAWTQFRRGDFREVLGTLAALHSPYYEKYFLMESALLRSFVYLSICSLPEMNKTLELFAKMYEPLKARLSQVLSGTGGYSDLFLQSEKSINALGSSKPAGDLTLPLPLARTLSVDPEFRKSYRRVLSLRHEREQLAGIKDWKNSELGATAGKYLDSRLAEAVKQAGKKARSHLEAKQREMDVHFRQYDFARYEMLEAEKQDVRGSQREAITRGTAVDAVDRNFFLSRGIEFYPFKGEYWLDEVGNSHFIGRNRCAKN